MILTGLATTCCALSLTSASTKATETDLTCSVPGLEELEAEQQHYWAHNNDDPDYKKRLRLQAEEQARRRECSRWRWKFTRLAVGAFGCAAVTCAVIVSLGGGVFNALLWLSVGGFCGSYAFRVKGVVPERQDWERVRQSILLLQSRRPFDSLPASVQALTRNVLLQSLASDHGGTYNINRIQCICYLPHTDRLDVSFQYTDSTDSGSTVKEGLCRLALGARRERVLCFRN